MQAAMSYTADISGERLDVFLARTKPDLSRSRIQKLITAGQVLVDGHKRKPNYRLEAGEPVSLALPEPEMVDAQPENIPLAIIYEDSDIIVVNKARGMVVHPAAGVFTGTLVNALLYHCHDLSGIGGAVRPGIVHRLDKDTSGVMVAAKNDAAHQSLARQIQAKSARRLYLALVHGNIAESEGMIKGDIGRHPTDRKKMAVVNGTGKPAVTKFRVRERFGRYTFIECELLTGRTHQIRVHMSHIGFPLVGDPKYGRRKPFPGINGQALHSSQLTLAHPATGETMVFQAPLPDDMASILHRLRCGEML